MLWGLQGSGLRFQGACLGCLTCPVGIRVINTYLGLQGVLGKRAWGLKCFRGCSDYHCLNNLPHQPDHLPAWHYHSPCTSLGQCFLHSRVSPNVVFGKLLEMQNSQVLSQAFLIRNSGGGAQQLACPPDDAGASPSLSFHCSALTLALPETLGLPVHLSIPSAWHLRGMP